MARIGEYSKISIGNTVVNVVGIGSSAVVVDPHRFIEIGRRSSSFHSSFGVQYDVVAYRSLLVNSTATYAVRPGVCINSSAIIFYIIGIVYKIAMNQCTMTIPTDTDIPAVLYIVIHYLAVITM